MSARLQAHLLRLVTSDRAKGIRNLEVALLRHGDGRGIEEALSLVPVEARREWLRICRTSART